MESVWFWARFIICAFIIGVVFIGWMIFEHNNKPKTIQPLYVAQGQKYQPREYSPNPKTPQAKGKPSTEEAWLTHLAEERIKRGEVILEK